MVRTVKNLNHHHDEEDEDDYDDDYISRTTDTSSHKDGRMNDQKGSSNRSKHSETEQRRRSKINERFQNLRDLIPQNDQKRDRASFLLEVIQYIHFLKEKLQVYEGTCQGWSPEITKLLRGNGGADNFADQTQPVRNGSDDERNIVLTPALFPNAQNLIEPDLSGSTVFRITDHSAPRAVSMNVPVRQNTFEAEPSQSFQGSFPGAELLPSQSRPEESSISNAYSKGLLNNLTHALGSCGVDLSQASISVQLDVRQGTSSGATSASLGFKDHDLLSRHNQATAQYGVRSRDDVSDQVRKRLRTKQNM